MDPELLRRYLSARGCKFHRKKVDGIEMWTRDGLNFPITFYNRGPISPEELERLTENLGLPRTDPGEWRKNNT